MNKIVTGEPRADIFTQEQHEQLRRLKSYYPYRIVWGSIHNDTQAFEAFATTDRRELNRRVRSQAYLVARLAS